MIDGMSAYARPITSMLRRDVAEAASGGAGGSSTAAPSPSTLVPARDTLDPKYTWDLSSIFTSWEAWDAAFAELDRGIESYKKYEGTLGQGATQLLDALRDRD